MSTLFKGPICICSGSKNIQFGPVNDFISVTKFCFIKATLSAGVLTGTGGLCVCQNVRDFARYPPPLSITVVVSRCNGFTA